MDDAPPLLRTLKNVRFAAQPVLYNEGSSFARSCDFGMATFTNACLPSRSPYGLAFTRSLDGRTDAAPLCPWDTIAAQPQESPLSGGFGTVYKGNFKDKTVAIKRVMTSAAASSSSSALSREIDILRSLSHPNVLPYYYGAEIYDGGVMPWAENRRIDSYLRRNPEVNRLEILQSIAEGLHYLHANNVIHGDLKPANILISDGGVPQLSNFGLSSDASLLEMNGSPEEMGSIRYMAPELVLYQEKPTKASDVFSWASTCYEILTNIMPYASTMSTSDIILAFYNGEAPYDGMKPLMNGHLNGLAIWGLMVASWIMDPGLRPNMQTILVNLQKHLKASEGKIAHL